MRVSGQQGWIKPKFLSNQNGYLTSTKFPFIRCDIHGRCIMESSIGPAPQSPSPLARRRLSIHLERRVLRITQPCKIPGHLPIPHSSPLISRIGLPALRTFKPSGSPHRNSPVPCSTSRPQVASRSTVKILAAIGTLRPGRSLCQMWRR